MKRNREIVGKMRFLDLECGEPYMKLAVKEAIPMVTGKRIVPNTIPFWRNLKAVVAERFQCVEQEANFEA